MLILVGFPITGAGESGKSTILKQMRLIHTAGFSKADRDQYRVIIFTNIAGSMKLILEAMDGYGIAFQNPENEQYVHMMLKDRELGRGEAFPREYLPALKSLWEDAGVQSAVGRGNEFALHDNLS